MKTLIVNINFKAAEMIKNENHEYLVWADGTEITINDIMNHFSLTEYPNGYRNLEHKVEDFRIENIIY